MPEPVDLRPGLAVLKSILAEDDEALAILSKHEPEQSIRSLANLGLLFVTDVCDDPARHVDVMFEAVSAAEKGEQL